MQLQNASLTEIHIRWGYGQNENDWKKVTTKIFLPGSLKDCIEKISEQLEWGNAQFTPKKGSLVEKKMREDAPDAWEKPSKWIVIESYGDPKDWEENHD